MLEIRHLRTLVALAEAGNLSVAAKRVPFFKVGKELKLRVDGKDTEAPQN